MKRIALKFFSLIIAALTISQFSSAGKAHASSSDTNALDNSSIPTTTHGCGCGCSSCSESSELSTLNN